MGLIITATTAATTAGGIEATTIATMTATTTAMVAAEIAATTTAIISSGALFARSVAPQRTWSKML
jgi:hypothetical protein